LGRKERTEERTPALGTSIKTECLKEKMERKMIHHLLLLAKNAEEYHMDIRDNYRELLQDYPQYMTKEQMYRVCHISKKTCLFLLENGLVPCVDSGKKTRRYMIKTAAVIRYLEDRALHPELYKPPEGFYKKKQSEPNRALREKDLLVMRRFFVAELRSYPDVVTTKQISAFTGYGESSVVRWCSKQQLKSFYIKRRFCVPKEYLIDFLVSWHFIGISVKSEAHRKLNEKIYKLL
jgi:hypothetical protein